MEIHLLTHLLIFLLLEVVNLVDVEADKEKMVVEDLAHLLGVANTFPHKHLSRPSLAQLVKYAISRVTLPFSAAIGLIIHISLRLHLLFLQTIHLLALILMTHGTHILKLLTM